MIGMRLMQIAFWASILFLIAPSKVAAIAYAIVIGGLTLAILIVVVLVKATLRMVDKIFRS